MEYLIHDSTLKAIADAIRQKTNIVYNLSPEEFASKILSIEGGFIGGTVTQVQLFAPTISVDTNTNMLTITDINGAFADRFVIYANSSYITTIQTTTINLLDIFQSVPTEDMELKIQSAGTRLATSDYSNIVTWRVTAGDDEPDEPNEPDIPDIPDTPDEPDMPDEPELEEQYDEGMWRIETSSTGECNIIGINKEKYALTDIINPVIPETINGYKVRGLGYGAFAGCTELRRINIPSWIYLINVIAFRQCTSLKSIYIPATVTQVGAQIFDACSPDLKVYCQASGPTDTWHTNWYLTIPAENITWNVALSS